MKNVGRASHTRARERHALLSPSCVSLPHAPHLFFFFFLSRPINFSRACHVGYATLAYYELCVDLYSSVLHSWLHADKIDKQEV